MKKVIICSAVVVLIFVSFVYYTIAAPHYYWHDGTTMWKRTMSVTHKASPLPYRTKYIAYWNAMSLLINDQEVNSKQWVEFALWNGYGIRKIEIFSNSGKKLYPQEEDVRNMSTEGFSAFFSTTEKPDHYKILGIIPEKGDTSFRIEVTDKFGNVTGDKILLSQVIKDPDAKKEKKAPQEKDRSI